MDKYDSWGVRSVQRVHKIKVVPGSGCRYKVWNPNEDSNELVDLVEHHVETLSQFQDIVDKSGEKVNFGDWLSVRMTLVEQQVICLGNDKAILKQYIFTKEMCDHKGKIFIVPKYKVNVIMIPAFYSWYFLFVYPLTVPDIETIN